MVFIVFALINIQSLGIVSAYFGKNISFCFHDSNNPEHSKVPCDDPDECAGDNGNKDKIQTAKQMQHFAGLFGGNRPVSRSGFTANFHWRTDLCHKRLSLTEHCRFLMETKALIL